jgi:putative oxidoreductase
MKTTVKIVRILIGILLLFSSAAYLFNLVPKPELQGDLKLFNEGIEASVYLLPLIKMTELVCGLAFITGRFVPLATVVIFPLTVNILLCHFFLAPEGLPVAVFLFLGNLALAYRYRDNFVQLVASKTNS